NRKVSHIWIVAVYVLIVTPVIFFWLREREVRREERMAMQTASTGRAGAASDEEILASDELEDPELAC
ncbi:MAG: hypothetical protein ACREAM_08905, partial [Blastocatellia bacterium]